MYTFSPWLLLFTLFCFSCNESSDNIDDTLCTTSFGHITMFIESELGYPIILSEYYSVLIDTKDTLISNKNPSSLGESYLPEGVVEIANDGSVLEPDQSESEVRFTGYRAGSLIINEKFVLKREDCHISKTSGADTVLIPEICSQLTLCTDNFLSIYAEIVYPENSIYKIDYTKTTNLIDNTIIYEQSFTSSDSLYVIVNDNHQGLLAKKGTQVRFEGSIYGNIVAARNFVIGHDCCHIIQLDDESTEFILSE